MMRKIVLVLLIAFIVISGLGGSARAQVIFQSKWDNPNVESYNEEDDGGNWHYAYNSNMPSGTELRRVSGDESNIGGGGPSGPPSAPNTTYYLRETLVGDGSSGFQIYLEDRFPSEYQGLEDYYGGMWFFLEKNISFINSVKFFDFKTENQEAGNGHLGLFGFCQDCRYVCDGSCNDGSYPGNTCVRPSGWPEKHNLYFFKYCTAQGDCSHTGYNFNCYDTSPGFGQNLDVDGNPIADGSNFNEADINRIWIDGGYWYSMIVHLKVHETYGEVEMWLKKGGGSLNKVMEWNRDTVWPQGTGPHDFYTKNGETGVTKLQIHGYWNNWPSFTGTKYVWLSNVIVATTFEDVANYLGVSSNDTTPTRSNPSPTGTLPAGTTSTNISLTTNVRAVCRYSNNSGTNYTEMEYNFTYTNSTNHSTEVSELENGKPYIYYIRCNSIYRYVNVDDWNISFSIDGHKADLNDDGLIDMPELMLFIARWKLNDGVTKAEVEEAKSIWFSGGVY